MKNRGYFYLITYTYLYYASQITYLNMQAKLLKVWGSKQEFSILKLFEFATQAGLEIGVLSFFGLKC